MLQWFEKLKTLLLSSLADFNYDCSITYEDWIIIKKSCDILKRFEEITKEMSTESGVTIYKTILFGQALNNFWNKIMIRTQTVPKIEGFINKLKDEVDKRFEQVEKHILLAECIFLDPHFIKYGFKNPIALQDVNSKNSVIHHNHIDFCFDRDVSSNNAWFFFVSSPLT